MPKPKFNPPAPNQSTTFETVSPVWLLRALAITLFSILLLFYLTYATLFYFGQWQLVLHPSRQVTQTPASVSLPYEAINFGTDRTGQPQLTGWFIPAAPPTALTNNSRYQNFTILYLHNATGSLSETVSQLAELHSIGINIFAIDYRGYGYSAPNHPTQSRMTDDTAAAFDYLLNTRHLLPTQIIPFGDGVGASLAASLAAQHRAVPAVILRNPPTNVLADVDHDPRSRLLPTHLIFNQRFQIAPTLADLKTPKLLIAAGTADATRPINDLFRSAASPKLSITIITSPSDSTATTQTISALTRFLDDYLSTTPTI